MLGHHGALLLEGRIILVTNIYKDIVRSQFCSHMYYSKRFLGSLC